MSEDQYIARRKDIGEHVSFATEVFMTGNSYASLIQRSVRARLQQR